VIYVDDTELLLKIPSATVAVAMAKYLEKKTAHDYLYSDSDVFDQRDCSKGFMQGPYFMFWKRYKTDTKS